MHIEVDSHTHTVASGHAYSTLAENAAVASKRGIKLLAVTDHGPAMPGAPHIWFFMNLRVLPRIINGVGILRGIEANIINYQGEFDIDADTYKQMDIVLGSLHEPLIAPKDRTAHTRGVIQAMESGRIDVFAHGGNPSFPIDDTEVARAAAHHKILIEINNSSFTTSRKGSRKNCEKLAEAVASEGGYLTFGSDAHIANNVGGFGKCLELVEKLGIPEETIISRNASKFLDFLKTKHPAIETEQLNGVL